MAKKEEILELLNSYKSEVDNFNYAVFTDKFEVLAQDIVKLFAIPVVKHRFSTPEKMAEWLHNNYEEIALNNGWKTQYDCQVPFCDLPT